MDIKMIVVDLDGTLLRNDKTMSKYTINALNQCREKGILLAFATARGGDAQVPVELFDGFIRTNGAVAFAYDKKVYEAPIPIKCARRILTAAENADIQIVAEASGKHYAKFDLKAVVPWLSSEIIDFEAVDFEPHKIYAISATKEQLKVLQDSLSDKLYMYISNDGVPMIMNKNAMKSKAVEALAMHWNIKPAEIIAFGDDANDIEMLEYCGVGVAMGNAIDEVKAVADFVCDTNENDGLAKWLVGANIVRL